MPDTSPLAEAFGYSKSNHGPSRFPVARLSLIELAGLNVVWDYRMDEYRCSEQAQLYAMWDSLPDGCICLMDRKYCSFYILAKLVARGIGVVVPLHQARDPQTLIAAGRPLGKDQWCVTLRLAPHMRKTYGDPSLPETLTVRLLRVRRRGNRGSEVLWLVAAGLPDRRMYPAKALAVLHRTRWEIETRIGSLKTTLEMHVLRSKSPVAARLEAASTILGHNLTWLLIHAAAERTDTPAATISFAGAVKTLLAFAPTLRSACRRDRHRIYHAMLEHIARQTNHHPPDRVEPRRIKRNPARYPFLQEPRWKARLKCLS